MLNRFLSGKIFTAITDEMAGGGQACLSMGGGGQVKVKECHNYAI